jgi:hypothetical protein
LDWGDGTEGAGDTVGGSIAGEAIHIYAAAGNYTIVPYTVFSGQTFRGTAVSVAVVPAAPLNLSASRNDNASVTLLWQPGAADESAFNVYRSTTPDFTISSATLIASGISGASMGGNEYTDTGLAPGTAYYYQVTAASVGGAGESAPSNQASATTGYVAPAVTTSPIQAAVGEGSMVPIGTFTAAGPSTSTGDYSAWINWGDGASDGGYYIAANNDGTFSVIDGHAYSSAGNFVAVLTVTYNPANLSGEADISVAVAGPQLFVNGNGSVTEGTSYALGFSSSMPVAQWSIDWGDNSGIETLDGGASSDPHVFSAPANRAIIISALVGGEWFSADALQ